MTFGMIVCSRRVQDSAHKTSERFLTILLSSTIEYSIPEILNVKYYNYLFLNYHGYRSLSDHLNVNKKATATAFLY